MDKRTGEHTNKETREPEDKRTSAKLQPNGHHAREDKNNRTRTTMNKIIGENTNKGTRE